MTEEKRDHADRMAGTRGGTSRRGQPDRPTRIARDEVRGTIAFARRLRSRSPEQGSRDPSACRSPSLWSTGNSAKLPPCMQNFVTSLRVLLAAFWLTLAFHCAAEAAEGADAQTRHHRHSHGGGISDCEVGHGQVHAPETFQLHSQRALVFLLPVVIRGSVTRYTPDRTRSRGRSTVEGRGPPGRSPSPDEAPNAPPPHSC